MKVKQLYIIEYSRCGCSDGPKPKRELLGYCATHGSDVQRVTPMWDLSKVRALNATYKKLSKRKP